MKYILHERNERDYPREPLLAATQTKGVVLKSDYENRTVVAVQDLHLLKLVKKGDFVISLRSFQGGIEVAHVQGIISPAYTVIYCRESGNRAYLQVFFKSAPFVAAMSHFVTGIRQGQNIDYSRLARAELPWPPQEEQLAIVRFCQFIDDRATRLIRNKRRLIALLNEEKQAIIQQAVTRGLDPDVPMKPSGVEWLGEIPEHWEVRRIKSLSQVRRGASPRPIDDPKYFDENGEYAWVRIADVSASERYLNQTTQRLSELGKSKSIPLEPGGLFLSIAATVGKPIITNIKCCIHDGFVYFPQFVSNTEFLYYVFRSGALWQGLGKVGTQLNLNTETVGSVRIPWPPAPEQERIVDSLDHDLNELDRITDKIQREIDLIREYRTRLIADVVTGQLDVRVAAASLPNFEDMAADLLLTNADDLDEGNDLTGEELDLVESADAAD